MYYSSPYINDFYQRIKTALTTITEDHEIIFVNDGSPDDSLLVARAIFEKDDKVRIFDLSRNFGHHKAIMTGLAQARGDYIMLLDVDLEEQPEWLNLFWDEIVKAEDLDVVYGVQKRRKGKYFEKASGGLFFKLFNRLSNIELEKNMVLARLMSRRYLINLLKFSEQEVAFAGICVLAGFRQKSIPIEKLHKGKTTYTLRRRIEMAVNFIASFSSKPLMYIFYTGILFTVLASLFILFLMIRRLAYGETLTGWTSIIASIWLVGGILIFCIGIVGIYLSKIFIEVKNRPSTIVKSIYEKPDSGGHS